MGNEPKQLSMKSDFIFKTLFSKKGNEELLKDFLESIINKKIKKIEVIEEAKLSQTSEEDKYGVLDLRVTLNDETIVDIEMQVRDRKNIEKRAVYYQSKLVAEQLSKKDDYQKIKDVIMIIILDYEFIKLPEYHTETVIVSKEHKDYEIIKGVKYHFIELPKYRRAKKDIENNKLEQWLAIIDGEDRGLIKMAKEKNEKIEEVEYQLHSLSEDEEIQRIEFLRLKAALDRNSDIGYAKREGQREKTIEIAKKMKKKDINIEEIIEITGLAKEEIENL